MTKIRHFKYEVAEKIKKELETEIADVTDIRPGDILKVKSKDEVHVPENSKGLLLFKDTGCHKVIVDSGQISYSDSLILVPRGEHVLFLGPKIVEVDLLSSSNEYYGKSYYVLTKLLHGETIGFLDLVKSQQEHNDQDDQQIVATIMSTLFLKHENG